MFQVEWEKKIILYSSQDFFNYFKSNFWDGWENWSLLNKINTLSDFQQASWILSQIRICRTRQLGSERDPLYTASFKKVNYNNVFKKAGITNFKPTAYAWQKCTIYYIYSFQHLPPKAPFKLCAINCKQTLNKVLY